MQDANRSFRTGVLAARLIAVAMLLLPMTSCHVLLAFPCLAMDCPTTVKSIPPHNDPFARALARGENLKAVASLLANVSQTQLDALGGRWPAEPSCTQTAAVGCRYSIPVEVTETEGFKTDPAGCALLEVAVVDGQGGRIDVRRLSYRGMTCPPKPVTPDGASTPAASSGVRLP